jgi:hypothetical protein
MNEVFPAFDDNGDGIAVVDSSGVVRKLSSKRKILIKRITFGDLLKLDEVILYPKLKTIPLVTFEKA